jgi:hypothetical protein
VKFKDKCIKNKMGQEVSVICPVCKKNKAVYKDVFRAECLNWNQYNNFKVKAPPFERFLGPDCLKYCRKKFMPINFTIGDALNKHFDKSNLEFREVLGFEEILDCYYDQKENICSWTFYSCDECIFIGDINRNEKFSEYNIKGVTEWHSQLP